MREIILHKYKLNILDATDKEKCYSAIKLFIHDANIVILSYSKIALILLKNWINKSIKEDSNKML